MKPNRREFLGAAMAASGAAESCVAPDPLPPVARMDLPDTGADKVGDEGFLASFRVREFPLPIALRRKHDIHLVFKGGNGEEIGKHDLHFICRTPTTTPIRLNAVRFERGL